MARERETPVLNPFVSIALTIIQIYIWLLIGAAIMSWLVAFHVINTRNQFVYMVMDFLYRITEPALRPIRRVLPHLGGIDISPVILILLLIFLQRAIIYYSFVL